MAYSDMDLDLEDEYTDFSEEVGLEGEGVFEEIDFEALGINPCDPTLAKPGSEEKVAMLAARYAAGLPLWHDEDCVDHGPGQSDDE